MRRRSVPVDQLEVRPRGLLVTNEHPEDRAPFNRHATFVNLTVSGLFKTAYTADTSVGWSPVGKIACYNTVGTFVGWIPIVG